MSPRRPCIELVDGRPCGIPSEGTRCPTHERPLVAADNRRRNAKTVAHGVKRSHFQHLRFERLARAGGFCELHADGGCTTVATTVHLAPALSGDHDRATIDDVQACCAHCHGVVDGARSAR
jgi:hypothetical protein